MYLLRRYFGIDAHEAEHVVPEWERTVLLDELSQDLNRSIPD